MKTHEQILESIRAREAGKTAAAEGRKMDANPHPEDSEQHWEWLDAWCVERSRMKRHNAPESDADMELTLELPMPSKEAQGGALLAASDCSAFRCIVADPPWKYGKWGSASDSPTARKKFPNGQWDRSFDMGYRTMTVEEIKALPVAKLAAEDCDLYLWTTQKYLPDAFGVLEAWGFRYCQTLTWCKTPRGTGQGGLYCPTTEFLLLGRKGKMPVKKRVETTWWNVKRTMRHSEKPEHFQDVIEAVSDEPRLELFARRKRLGWHHWGNEIASDVEMPNEPVQPANKQP